MGIFKLNWTRIQIGFKCVKVEVTGIFLFKKIHLSLYYKIIFNSKKMYRQVFIPSEQNNVITIPRKWYGKEIEVIVFPVTVSNKVRQQNIIQNRRKEIDELFDKYPINLSGFKFNRDEANNYD